MIVQLGSAAQQLATQRQVVFIGGAERVFPGCGQVFKAARLGRQALDIELVRRIRWVEPQRFPVGIQRFGGLL